MSKQNPDLIHLKVASPCPASWNEMEGDERKRFCSECKLNVYNLSEMSHKEAKEFLSKAEGRICVRMYQRKDGSVLTKDCPVGLAAVRRKFAYALSLGFAMLFGGFVVAKPMANNSVKDALEFKINRIREIQPFKTVIDFIDPQYHTLGAMAAPNTVIGDVVSPTPPEEPVNDEWIGEAMRPETIGRIAPPSDEPVMGKLVPEDQPLLGEIEQL